MSKLAKIEKNIAKGKEDNLLKMLNDKEQDVRLAVIDGLGKIGKDNSCNALISLIDDDDAEIRIASIKALGLIGDEHTATHLRHRMEREKEERVIQEIKQALSNLNKYER